MENSYYQKNSELLEIIDNSIKDVDSTKQCAIPKLPSYYLWFSQQRFIDRLMKFKINSKNDIFEIKLWSYIDERFAFVDIHGEFEEEKSKLKTSLMNIKKFFSFK